MNKFRIVFIKIADLKKANIDLIKRFEFDVEANDEDEAVEIFRSTHSIKKYDIYEILKFRKTNEF